MTIKESETWLDRATFPCRVVTRDKRQKFDLYDKNADGYYKLIPITNDSWRRERRRETVLKELEPVTIDISTALANLSEIKRMIGADDDVVERVRHLVDFERTCASKPRTLLVSKWHNRPSW